MIAYCEGFIISVNDQMPPAVLLAAYEMPKYENAALTIKGRPMITAPDAEYLPALFLQAIQSGLIEPETYEAEKARLLKNHGIVI